LQINYDFNPNQQTSQRFNPQLGGKYAFWPTVTNWSTYNLPFVYANLAVETPVSGTSNTIRVRIDGQDHDLLFIGGDTSQPPMVQTYTTNSPKSAKPVTKQHVWAYENNGNLVIKWDEPADLIDPYWQLRVFIGSGYSNATPSPIPTSPVTYATLEVSSSGWDGCDARRILDKNEGCTACHDKQGVHLHLLQEVLPEHHHWKK